MHAPYSGDVYMALVGHLFALALTCLTQRGPLAQNAFRAAVYGHNNLISVGK